MNDEAALAEIRMAAQATLDVWPEARAAVLFGSRARGDHRPDSDRDVAFITVGGGGRLDSIPEGLPFGKLDVGQYINEITIPEKLVERQSLCIGHVGRGIAVDGQILAGTWERPKTEGTPFMETERYRRSMHAALRMIRNAVDSCARTGAPDSWPDAPGEADDFVAATADAAEHLVKAVMGRQGIYPRRTHDLSRLADQMRKAGHAALAEDFIRMNGQTQRDHEAHYGMDAPENLAHAVICLPVVLELLLKEMNALPAGFLAQEESDELTSSAVRILSACAEALSAAVRRDGNDMQPPEPYVWLKPLVGIRETLTAKLDVTAEALRKGSKESGNDSERRSA